MVGRLAHHHTSEDKLRTVGWGWQTAGVPCSGPELQPQAVRDPRSVLGERVLPKSGARLVQVVLLEGPGKARGAWICNLVRNIDNISCFVFCHAKCA